MADHRPPPGHNGGPPLDDPTPQRPSCCRDCRHWQPPPESLERDYEFFRLGLSRRRVKKPTGFCDRVLLGNSRIPAFSGTAGDFTCRNFEPVPPRLRSRGGGFITIWVGDRVVWKGPEDEIPPRFLDADP
ncbi:hypothetical protein [Reyranella sp.]|jgi:hypothetical protein|uniref:hypothetical protein n=1 Tax=Reyranella sp. TaxID=1929291 RepID=UPI000BCD2BAC|nr:hypothetical protein [Reyranella sp.]OYW32420.1 MAG: hypothetical protein B7Z41_08490 [Rhizobiales bacterium 12-66-7]OYY87960.1 MAG: hypothetical protein B7Y61_04345 [Rhizobiales bacterium 35-66-30]OYZ82447.1 MAG: hypothetical protein B7Y12_03430 [Rhizobiales bacterium 24-66-13]OZB11562.1 MAG: hypothetical protein B7X67_03365 [Rhizobiales bacterium 39-66-18]HQS08169.1 hypothetical protein [Xanthobacteraceae bacterium]